MSQVSPIVVPQDLVHAEVNLIGIDGNAFSIIGAVSRGLRKAGNSSDIIDDYRKQAMSSDYNHLIRVSMEFCA